MEATVERLDHDVNGNGKKGLRDSMSEISGAIKFIMWFAGITLALVCAIVAYLSYRAVNDPHQPAIGHAQTQSENGSQNAGDPSIPRN